MILVVGSTGFLGSEICRQLVARKRSVRGLVRPTSDSVRVSELKTLGVQLIEGDLKDRRSLERACDGVNAVISTATATRSRQQGDSIETADAQGQMSLVEVSRIAEVSRFIYVSYSGQIGREDPLTRAKRAVEQLLKQSGMKYTILRPSYFMEAWLSPALGFDYVNAKATIYGSGQNKISWISLLDVAEFAVATIDNPAAENACIELGGPEAVSPLEVIGIFEQLGWQPFQVQLVPEETLRAQQLNATDPLQQAFTALMLGYAKGDSIPMEKTLNTYPVHLRSIRDYASRALSALKKSR